MILPQDHGTGIFILYLILSSNFLVPLLPCRTNAFISKSMPMQHFLGFLTLMFFVVLASNDQKSEIHFYILIALSIVLYAWFVISTHMNHKSWMVMILALALIYLIDVYQKHDPHESKRVNDILAKVKIALFVLSLVATAFGFVLYMGERKIEDGSKFDFTEFLFGRPDCREEPAGVHWLDAVEAAIGYPITMKTVRSSQK
jgi:hypothetical protein